MRVLKTGPEQCWLMCMAQCTRRPQSTRTQFWTSLRRTLRAATPSWGLITPQWLAAWLFRITAAPLACGQTSPAAGARGG